ncbi:uncharacterized protein LOC132279841 [Cornus florida]|uniref:uncharacterized protein LOC132279841 n=1 Tax=Cornus florida TaxID=4283 RepID=UPI002897D6CE|nr:uncharacterized protein LOC132279841 [Cornus florida]
MAVLKMAVVVVLALGTKKFAIWITISALLLMFLEFASKQLPKLFKQCLNSQKSFNLLIQRLRNSHDKVVDKEVTRVLKLPIEQETGVSAFSVLVSRELNPLVEEIEIVQPNSEFEMSDCNRKWGCEKLDTNKGVSEKQEDHTSDVVELKRVVISEEQEQEEENKDVSLLFSSSVVICCSGELLLSEVQEIAVREEEKRETQRNSGYIILFLIVLVGLLGGRSLALVITFSWCLMLKLLRRLQLGDGDQLSCQKSS